MKLQNFDAEGGYKTVEELKEDVRNKKNRKLSTKNNPKIQQIFDFGYKRAKKAISKNETSVHFTMFEALTPHVLLVDEDENTQFIVYHLLEQFKKSGFRPTYSATAGITLSWD